MKNLKSRKYIFLTILAVCLSVAVTLTCFDATRDNPFDPKNGGAPGPIAYWNFEEVYTLPIGGSTVYDKSGNGYNGLINEPNGGNPSQSGDVPSGLGHYYSLNFVQGTEARVYLTNTTLFNFENSKSKFTVELWAKIGSVWGSDSFLVSKWGDDASIQAGWMVGLSVGSNIILTLSGTGGAAAANCVRVISPAITLNQWYHIACTVDVENDVFKIFLNGVDNSTFDAGYLTSISNIYSNNARFTIGAKSSIGNAANSYIDEVKIYNYIRTPSQILADATH
jgi:hypothetical protein